jgi:hypothetical protein
MSSAIEAQMKMEQARIKMEEKQRILEDKIDAMMMAKTPMLHIDPGGLQGGAGVYSAQAIGRAPPPPRRYTLEEKLSARMDWAADSGWSQGFSHMAVHRAGDMVHVWIITKDAKSAVLEDGAELYPSDALITKIRLLQQG